MRHLVTRPVLVRALLATAMAAAPLAGCASTGSPSPLSTPASTGALVPSSSTPPAVTPVPVTPTPAEPTLVPTPVTSLPPLACGGEVRRAGSVPIARIRDFSVVNDGTTGRITFDFRPEGNVAAVPEVVVRPSTPPFTMDPSGLPLDVAGSAFVVITLHGGTALDNDFNPTFGGPFDMALDGGPIVEVKRAGDFEAVASWVVGFDGPPCVRILPPDGSSRLVIEIETE